jgi:hypothetical protein
MMRSIGIAGLVLLAGCAKEETVTPIRNVERAVAVWGSPRDFAHVPHICLEYATPAHELDEHKATLGIPIGKNKVELSYESSESLALIYTVSETMQFGHAVLYRLCEAAANGDLNAKEYSGLFADTLNSMQDLIALQLRARDAGLLQRAEKLRKQIEMVDKELCELAAAQDEGKPQDRKRAKELKGERKALKDKYDDLELAFDSKLEPIGSLVCGSGSTPSPAPVEKEAVEK